MDIAKSFFLPPWKLVGGSKLLWYIRLEAIREYDAKRMEMDRRKAKSSGSLDEINARQRRKR